MNESSLIVQKTHGVAEVILNRPERRNAFDDLLIERLIQALTELNADDAVRVIVLKGSGKSFSAGADLEWMRRMAGYSYDENLADATTAEQMFATLATSPKATIAQVHGAAMGGGAGLVAACDIGIAASDTVFSFSEVRLGIAPAIIAPYVLQKLTPGVARALFVTAKQFSADEALRLGLIQEVVAPGDLDAAVQRTVEEILQASPAAIAALKQLLRNIHGKSPEDAAEATVACIADLRVSAEGQEGLKAFLEKRAPAFSERTES